MRSSGPTPAPSSPTRPKRWRRWNGSPPAGALLCRWSAEMLAPSRIVATRRSSALSRRGLTSSPRSSAASPMPRRCRASPKSLPPPPPEPSSSRNRNVPAIELIANAGVALVGWAGWVAAVYFYWQLGRTHELLDRAERAVRRAAHQVRRAGLLTARRRQSMTLDDRLTAAINQSLGHALARMAEEGVPAGID